MPFWDSLILGVVEGITEFLPISSTGHLILASDLLGLFQTDFLKSFEIIIQLGAITAVIFLYWRSFLKISVWQKVLAAFLPTGIIGFFLYNLIKQYLIGNKAVVLWALVIGGVALIIFEKTHKEKEEASGEIENISYRQALGIGVFQSLAVVPGLSRSAATIIGGLILGLKRETIIKFSFLLAVPTMLAASGWDLLKSAGSFAAEDFNVLAVGFVVSFLTALAVIKWLLNFVKKHNFISFGIYRILVAGIFWLFILR
ncbi:MAG: undecaprenyl-diphosphate phosphatase [bacterium]|nr:undecaprenyl-diphosphate phosphatase [bacterium]